MKQVAIRCFLAMFIAIAMSACATNTALNTDSQRIDAELASAERAYQEGQYDEAQKQFAAILKQAPSHLDAHFRLGNIALRQSQLKDARGHYQAVLERQPDSTKAHYNLALVNLLEAEQHFHFHTATAGDNAEQQSRLFVLIDAIHTFLDDDSQSQQPKTALDSLADVLSQSTP